MYKIGFQSSLNVRSAQGWPTILTFVYLCLYHKITSARCTFITFTPCFEMYLNIFPGSHISWRLSWQPEDSIPTISWATAYHTVLVPHGCKCIWMALIGCKSRAYLWTGSSESSIWAAPDGTRSSLRCHLDPQSTQLPVQCLLEYSTLCEPIGTHYHHGRVHPQSH